MSAEATDPDLGPSTVMPAAETDRRSRRHTPGSGNRKPRPDDVVLGMAMKRARVGLEVSVRTVQGQDGAFRVVSVSELWRDAQGRWFPNIPFRGVTIHVGMLDELRGLLDAAAGVIAAETAAATVQGVEE